MPRIIGIDPGSRLTGYGILDSQGQTNTYVASGVIQTSGKTLSEKLAQIYEGVQTIVAEYRPDISAIEQVFMHVNPNASLKLGQARGAAIVGLARAGLEVAEYSPRAIKKAAVGYGAAGKNQIQAMLKHMLKIKGALQVDASDALAVALCHSMHVVALKIPVRPEDLRSP